MDAPRAEENIKVAFEHRIERPGGRPWQLWRSLATGREFEVQETDSYASSDELTSGQEAYLTFVAGRATVTDVPLDRLERAERQREMSSFRPQTRELPRRRTSPVGLILVAVLVALILWALL